MRGFSLWLFLLPCLLLLLTIPMKKSIFCFSILFFTFWLKDLKAQNLQKSPDGGSGFNHFICHDSMSVDQKKQIILVLHL